MRHLLRPTDFTREEIGELIETAQDIQAHPEKYAHVADGRSWPPAFTNRARGRVSVLNRR